MQHPKFGRFPRPLSLFPKSGKCQHSAPGGRPPGPEPDFLKNSLGIWGWELGKGLESRACKSHYRRKFKGIEDALLVVYAYKTN